MSIVTVSEARGALPDLLNQVAQGDEITITRHGHAAAVLVHPDLLRIRRTDALYGEVARVRELLAGERGDSPAELTNARAEELVSEIRAARDAR